MGEVFYENKEWEEWLQRLKYLAEKYIEGTEDQNRVMDAFAMGGIQYALGVLDRLKREEGYAEEDITMMKDLSYHLSREKEWEEWLRRLKYLAKKYIERAEDQNWIMNAFSVGGIRYALSTLDRLKREEGYAEEDITLIENLSFYLSREREYDEWVRQFERLVKKYIEKAEDQNKVMDMFRRYKVKAAFDTLDKLKREEDYTEEEIRILKDLDYHLVHDG
jgi:hypothetical protein